MYREIEDVVETLRLAKERRRGCSILIGAGCSISAGIPSAAGFIQSIRDRYPRAYGHAPVKTYARCMAELAFDEQRDLIGSYIDNAKVNWAHLAIAQLMKSGHIDRVLTTNFDPLVVRACAMIHLYPATYDFAISQLFSPEKISDQAVIYLHGQRSGFVLLNTQEELAEHSRKLAPVFADAGRGRVWVVVGYSGENDPVFDHLASVPRFDNKLYWVGYKDREPAPHIREKLLTGRRDAYYVRGSDADEFFVRLAQELNCFPPEFISAPLDHVEKLCQMVTPYRLPGQHAGQNAELDIVATTVRVIADMRTQYAEWKAQEGSVAKRESDLLNLQTDVLAGNYSGVMAAEPSGDPIVVEATAWAHLLDGNEFFRQGRMRMGTDKREADKLFVAASERYAAALAVKKDLVAALDNWGAALVLRAALAEGEAAAAHLAEAEKILFKAEKVLPGSGSYNLACIASHRGNAAEAVSWLENAERIGVLPEIEHLQTDPDLNHVRHTPEFTAYMESLLKQQTTA